MLLKMQILYKNETTKKQFCSKHKTTWRYPDQVKRKLESVENFILNAESLMDVANYPPYRFEHLKGKRKTEDRVVLAMNNRGLYADKIWFSLFHEIKHVLQQKIKTVFVSSMVEEMIDINNNLEIEADKFATNYLISPTDYKRFAPSKYTSDDEIV